MPSNEFMRTLSRKIKFHARVDNHAMLKLLSAAATLIGLLGLSACQPSLNWRAIQLDGSALRFELPCKPDRTTRAVNMAGEALELSVAGCEADDAIWAVMATQAPISVDREALIKGWRQATLQNMRATEVQEVLWAPQKAALTGAVRIKAQGTNPNGQALLAHAVWFSHLEGNQLRMVHAVVYQNNPKKSQSQQGADLFIESFKLP
jgi:hypothetical protein